MSKKEMGFSYMYLAGDDTLADGEQWGQLMPTSPDAVFLGIAERSTQVRDGQTPFLKWNILGLKPIVLVLFFPISLRGFNFAFAFRGLLECSFTLEVRSETDDIIGTVGVTAQVALPGDTVTRSAGLLGVEFGQEWSIFVITIPDDSFVVSRSGRYFVSRRAADGSAETVGEFCVVLAEPAPMTAEQVAAIRSDPRAIKAARAQIGCKNCSSKVRAYAALDRGPPADQEDFTWYQDLPDQFACDCGSTVLDLRSLRRNFFSVLGQPTQADSQLRYVPMYERGALDGVAGEFLRLLDKDPREEELQKFIEDNPILLHQFPAERLFFKPRILTFFSADFGIVTPQKELVLIEIERAGTRLLKKDGGAAAELTHAIDQVHSWLHVVDEHRLAVLDSLKISRDMVGSVWGVVIAGRDRGHDAEYLRRLKGADRGPITVLTFDDLAFGLIALARRMTQL